MLYLVLCMYMYLIFLYTSPEIGGMKENMKLRGLFERLNNVAVGKNCLISVSIQLFTEQT